MRLGQGALAVIRAEGLARRFGDFVAVEGVDLDVAEGEVFGLLGPNGAGKTTTVRMLSALIAPSHGRAVVAGHSVLEAPEKVRASVGILTETPGLYVRLDAVENLRFFGELHGVRDLEARIRTVLERLDLWPRRGEPVGSFSKGMRQRVAIARALLHEPKVVFLDEPTSGLDPVAARTVRDLVRELRDAGRTVVLCTHNLDEAERLCDRIAVIRTRVLEVGSPAALRRGLTRVRTVVRLAAPVRAGLAEVVRACAFVLRHELEGERLEVELADPDADGPLLVDALVRAGARIRTVTEETRTLEEVYFSLVGADVAPDGVRGTV